MKSTLRRLVELEPDLVALVPPAERELVLHHLVVPELAVPPGSGDFDDRLTSVIAVLVIDGLPRAG